jgi:hypothetical protein
MGIDNDPPAQQPQ